MIASHDRSSWFGASDAYMITGNWDTPSFAKWWLVKLGANRSHFTNRAMAAGTAYEHRILDTIGVTQKDRQIRIPELRLRVNLDGETDDIITEIKTYKTESESNRAPKVSKRYWQQVQVQMFAAKKPAMIVYYRLTDREYENFFLPIDVRRLHKVPVEYDKDWVEKEFLPKLKYLAYCLDRRVTPRKEEFDEGNWTHPFDWRGWLYRASCGARQVIHGNCKRAI